MPDWAPRRRSRRPVLTGAAHAYALELAGSQTARSPEERAAMCDTFWDLLVAVEQLLEDVDALPFRTRMHAGARPGWSIEGTAHTVCLRIDDEGRLVMVDGPTGGELGTEPSPVHMLKWNRARQCWVGACMRDAKGQVVRDPEHPDSAPLRITPAEAIMRVVCERWAELQGDGAAPG